MATTPKNAESALDRTLGRWLSLVRAHSLIVHGVVAVLIILIADAIVIGASGKLLGLGESLGLECVIVGTAVAIPTVLTVAALRRPFSAIFALVADAPPEATAILLKFISAELELLDERIVDLRTIGTELDGLVVTQWVRTRCFEVTGGQYLATDALLPSEFMAIYPSYLRGSLTTCCGRKHARSESMSLGLPSFSSTRLHALRPGANTSSGTLTMKSSCFIVTERQLSQTSATLEMQSTLRSG